MNTEDIIQAHLCALNLCQATSPPPLSLSLPNWVDFYRLHATEISEHLPANIPAGDTLKPDALARIMVRSFLPRVQGLGSQPWDRTHVRSIYGACVDNCHFVYYPSICAKRLVVHFSSMGKDKFDRYSRYWDSTQQWTTDSAHLFFKDDEFLYFIGNDDHPMTGIYSRLIRHFRVSNSLNESQVFTVGSSMGGYGALYYALTLNLGGSVVCSPQVTRKAMHAHTQQNWIRNARSTGQQWVDIDMLVHRHRTQSPIYVYIEVGTHSADVIAVDALAHALESKPGLLIKRRATWKEHTHDSVLPKAVIDQTIQYFETHRTNEGCYV